MKLYQLIEELKKLPVEDQLKHVKFYDREDDITLTPNRGICIDRVSDPGSIYIDVLG
jgi:hypothetical protein